MIQKLYTDMSADEQLQWVTDFAQTMERHGDRLMQLAKGKAAPTVQSVAVLGHATATLPDRSRSGNVTLVPDRSRSGNPTLVPDRSRSGNVTTDDAAAIRRIFTLLAAWPFAQDFCEKAQRYGDYMARATRLPIYIEKVKERLADGLTMTDANGRLVAYVSPSSPMRRRGRPTKEETAARLRGENLADFGQTPTDDPEARKRRTIAALLGLQVIVHGDAPREKNNAELAADRAARKVAYDRQNPSLFPADTQPPAVAKGASVTSAPGGAAQEVTNPAKAVEGHGDDRSSVAAKAVSSTPVPAGLPVGTASRQSVPDGLPVGKTPCAQLQSDAYALRMSQDKLHLNQLAWLLTPDLAARTETVQSLRVTAESASERAKTLADLGQPADVIAPYAQQAKEATEAYLAIYADVDEELAILHRRLYLDLPFVERFKTRFKGVDIEKVLHICRPYYEKIREKEKIAVEEARAKAKSKGEDEEQTVAAYLADHQPIDNRVKTIIERDNPEYAARMKAEEEKKKEVSDILRYIKRKDKPNVAQRIRTMETRYARLIELLGETEARTYRPIVDAAIADYEQNHKKPEKPAVEHVAVSQQPSDTPSSLAGDVIAKSKTTIPDRSRSGKPKKPTNQQTTKSAKK